MSKTEHPEAIQVPLLMAGLAEFLGTFIFISVVLKSGKAIPIAIALAAVIFFATGISKTAFNPAISFAQYQKGDINDTEFATYVGAQLVAALLAVWWYVKYNQPEVDK